MIRPLLIIAGLTASMAVAAPPQKGAPLGNGRPATCLVDTPPRAACSFVPRNGDGSFAIRTNDGVYYATRVGPDAMRVRFDNGVRSVDSGIFHRSRDDRACWVRPPDRRLCAW